VTQPKLPQVPGAGPRAREQADAYESVFAPTPLLLDNGDTIEIPPHPNLSMLDDDRQEAYEELLFEMESYDHHPDIYYPEQKLDSGIVLPAETRRGQIKGPPYTKDGELVKPPHSIRVARIALGDTDYKRLREGGKSAADVWLIWNEQAQRITDRQTFRSETNGSRAPLGSLSR
jgi:hypothetical protein